MFENCLGYSRYLPAGRRAIFLLTYKVFACKLLYCICSQTLRVQIGRLLYALREAESRKANVPSTPLLTPFSRARLGRLGVISQVSAAVCKTALRTCSSERKLNAHPHTLFSWARRGRSFSTSHDRNVQAELALFRSCSSGKLLTASAHTLF